MSVCQSIYPFIYSSLWLSGYHTIRLAVCLSGCQSSVAVWLYICQAFCLSGCLSVCPFVYSYVCLAICSSSVCLSVHNFVNLVVFFLIPRPYVYLPLPCPSLGQYVQQVSHSISVSKWASRFVKQWGSKWISQRSVSQPIRHPISQLINQSVSQ